MVGKKKDYLLEKRENFGCFSKNAFIMFFVPKF